MIHDEYGFYTKDAKEASNEIRNKCREITEILTAKGFSMSEVLYLINGEVQLKLLYDNVMNRKNKGGNV